MSASRAAPAAAGGPDAARGWVVALWAVVALGLLLRFWNLGQESFWLDELFSVWSSRVADPAEVVRRISSDVHPPLYQLLLALWMKAFGATEVGARSFSAVGGSLAVLAMAFGARPVLGRRGALAAAAVLAGSHFAIFYAKEARSYALLTLYGTLLALAFATFVDRLLRGLVPRVRPGDWALWTVAVLLLASTHFYGVFFAGVTVLVAAAAAVRVDNSYDARGRVLALLGLGVLAVAILAGWLVGTRFAALHGQRWIESPDRLVLARTAAMWLGGPQPWKPIAAAPALLLGGLSGWLWWRGRTAATAVAATGPAGRRPRPRASGARLKTLAGWCLAVPVLLLLLAFATSFLVPTATPRNFIVGLPLSVIALIAWWQGLEPVAAGPATAPARTPARTPGWLMAAAALSAVALGVSWLKDRTIERQQWREAARATDDLAPGRPAAILYDASNADFWAYYLERHPAAAGALREGFNDNPSLLAEARRRRLGGADVVVLKAHFMRQPDYATGIDQPLRADGCRVWTGLEAESFYCPARVGTAPAPTPTPAPR